MRGGRASVMGNRYVTRSDTRKIRGWDNNIFYRISMCQNLPTEIFVENEVIERNDDKLLK